MKRVATCALLLALVAGTAAAAPPAAKRGAAKPAAARAARTPTPAAHRAARPVVYTLWQELLNDHLWTTSEPGEPIETRFNYEKYFDEPGRAERSARIRAQFLGTDPGKLDAKGRLAWAINFYNYLVVEQITEHLLIPNKVRQRYLSVQDIRPEGEDFFRYPLVRVDTTTYSLDSFERHFLFADFDHAPGKTPPKTLDPRVHFAIVNGAVGSPTLMQRAYRADSLDLQLDRAVRAALANPRHFKPIPGANGVQLSAIFFRYAPDFGGLPAALAWARPYLPKATRAALDPRLTPMTSQVIWDWKLNQVVGWRFYDQMSQRPPGVPHDSS